MQTITNISIPEPCHQNWNDMTPVDQGRHCQLCQKNVIDFTQMSNTEVISYINNYTSVCGRFEPAQFEAVNNKLMVDSKMESRRPQFAWKKFALAAAIAGLFVTAKASAQKLPRVTHQSPIANPLGKIKVGAVTDTLIKGTVIGDDSTAFAGALISVNRTIITTLTDAKGEFSVRVPVTADSVKISSAGYESREVSIADLSNGPNRIRLSAKNYVLGGAIVCVMVVKKFFYKRWWQSVKSIF